VPGIDVLGWVEPNDLPARFEAAQTAIVPWLDTPSNRARHSAKVLELMKAGLPIVAYAVGELVPTVGDAGVLVEPGDDTAFSRAVVALLSDSELALRLGAMARERILDRFTWEHLCTFASEAYRQPGRRQAASENLVTIWRGPMQPGRRLRTSWLPRWALVLAWMMLVFWLSAQSSLPSLTDRFGDIQSFAGHVIEYAVLTLLLKWALDGSQPAADASTVGHAGRWAFVIVVAYGITDELHQRFVPGRHMDPFDLLTDAGAAFAALWIVGVARGRRARALPEDEGSPVDRSEQA